MQKTNILIVIIITGLAIIACGFGGFAQQKVETQPASVTATSEMPVVIESLPTEDVESRIQIERTPTPTIDHLSSAKNCLANTWQINGLSEYVLAAIPPELVEEYGLEYVNTTGQAYMTLSADGKIMLQVEDLAFLFNARFSIFEVPVTVRIDGTAEGTYTVDNSTLTVDNMNTSRLTASAQALNEDLMDSAQIINAIPFIRAPFNKAEFSCQDKTLELELSGYPGDIPPLVFQAVK